MLPLDPKQSKTFCQTLEGCHQAFSLEEGERGETALVQLEIVTGDAAPRQQCPRRIPFALREEVSKQLKSWTTSWTSLEIPVTTPGWTWHWGIGRLESARSREPRLPSPHTKAYMSSWSCPLG